MDIRSKIASLKTMYSLLGISLLYFIIKGLDYAIIGSYIPLIFILFWIILIIWSFSFKQKHHLRVLKYWIIMVLIWAVARIGVWIIIHIDTGLTESHLREQFNIFQNCITIVMLVIAINVLKIIRGEKSINKNNKTQAQIT